MKCPLSQQALTDIGVEVGCSRCDCLQADCAWWFRPSANCCILDIALTLNLLHNRLQDILAGIKIGGAR